MLPPQPQTTQHTYSTSNCRNIQQRQIACRRQCLSLEFRIGFVVERRLLQAIESRGKDYVPREQNPDAGGGQDIVQRRDVVQAEQHVDVAGARRCLAALQGRARWWFFSAIGTRSSWRGSCQGLIYDRCALG